MAKTRNGHAAVTNDEVADATSANGRVAKMKNKEYLRELHRLHGELVALQEWVRSADAKVCVVFEGRDTAGKGGTIKAITARVSPRVFRVVALPAPTEREKSQMYIQRYIPHFPAAGEVVIFDRSWYNRAGVERVMGFCTEDQVAWFFQAVPGVEKAMVDSGIVLLKYWLEVSQEEQTRRLEDRINDPRKIWKLSAMDLKSYGHWYDYSRARDEMFAATDTAWAPWYVADSDDKRRARLNVISHLLDKVDYNPYRIRRSVFPRDRRPRATSSRLPGATPSPRCTEPHAPCSGALTRRDRLMSSFVPGLALLRSYQMQWLRRDVVAGLILTALLVPQGMAYAELAGLPAITGLYTSILCLAGYALFGPSKILVLGPDSSLGPMIAATILPLVGAEGDPARAVALASMLALLVGALITLAGITRLGFVADLLSKPIMIGYMNGLALTILIGQLPKLFGFSVEGDTFIAELRGFVKGIGRGESVTAALTVGLFGLVVILVCQRWLPKLPGVLAAVVLSIAAASAFDLAARGVSLVGTLPKGFPPLTIPHVRFSDLRLLVAGAVGIAVVSLADTISTASSFAARSGEEIDGSREMIGIGAANVAAGFFQGFPVSTSGSRTAVAEQSGAKTQVTGLVGALAILLMLLLVPGLLRNLPQPTLAAVVIAAALSLADVRGTRRLFRQRRSEFALSIAAFLGVALLGVLPGIAVAVGLSVANVFRHLWWPYRANLGRVPGVAGYHDRRSYPAADLLERCAIFRFDAPLFFANARTFREDIRALARSEPPPLCILVAAEPITDVDSTAADMLEDLVQALDEQGISLVFAELKDPVRRKFDRYGLIRSIGASCLFPTLEDAIAAVRGQTGARWASAGRSDDTSAGEVSTGAQTRSCPVVSSQIVHPGNQDHPG